MGFEQVLNNVISSIWMQDALKKNIQSLVYYILNYGVFQKLVRCLIKH